MSNNMLVLQNSEDKCPPFYPPFNQRVRIAIVGDYPGEQEIKLGAPFVGGPGQELTSLLKAIGIDRQECMLTNVFDYHPPGNDHTKWLVSKTEAKKRAGGFYSAPAIQHNKYISPEHIPALARLKSELERANPTIIICLGSVAAWAVISDYRVSKIRGTVGESTLLPGTKAIATYHPAAILRQWENRPILLLDLQKALRESTFPEIKIPEKQIYIPETFEDILAFEREFMPLGITVGVDIETGLRQTTCIGFAPSKHKALVIPLLDDRVAPNGRSFLKHQKSYWSFEDEVKVWNWIKQFGANPGYTKVFHNGAYDVQYLFRQHGVRIANWQHDTMLLHHSLQPELLKSLGFLSSCYTNNPEWKTSLGGGRHRKAKDAVEKADE